MVKFCSHRITIFATLVLGLSFGAAAALVDMNRGSASANKTLAKFEIDSANTPGFPQIKIKGADFSLIDHNGNPRTTKNPKNEHQLIFFGYANCKAICSQALKNLGESVDLLHGMGLPVTPVLITVDPKRDTVATLNKAVKEIHPKLVGLTGSEQQLAKAYKAFHIEKKFLFEHIDEGAIYSHTSFVFLLGPAGEFKTLFPPVINPVRIAEISAGYITNN